jgi:hypothetical protein
MEISRGYVEDAIPREDPPIDGIPGDVMEAAFRFENPVFRRSLLWTTAIFQELREGRGTLDFDSSPFLPSSMDFWPRILAGEAISRLLFLAGRVSVGLLDSEYERASFGLAIHFQGPSPAAGIIGEIYFGRLDMRLPVAFRPSFEEHHGSPLIAPITGQSACWAEETTSGTMGVLTAKHCTNSVKVGGAIALSPSGKGTVISKGAYVIDAALIDPGVGYPTRRYSLRTLTYPAAGLPVKIHAPTGAIGATIASVTETHGVIDDHLHPIKVYLDRHAAPGDSGCLISTTANEAVAIYSGMQSNATYKGKSGVTLGHGQHIVQAAKLLDLDLYD